MIAIAPIQRALIDAGLDGWLLADFHGRNTVATELLSLATHLTRRFFYYIPASGNPTALVHNIEKLKFAHLPGRHLPFTSFHTLEKELADLLAGNQKIAMEYSPHGRLPYIGLVDAGTIELVRSFGCTIVSSADLVSHLSARLSDEQIASHRRAAANLLQIKDAAFQLIAKRLQTGERITEWDVVSFIRDQFSACGMISEFGPNCSVDANAGNPHYDPDESNASEIRHGSLILIDLWAQETNLPDREQLTRKDQSAQAAAAEASVGSRGAFADITWMAYAGRSGEIPNRFIQLFAHVTQARDAAIDYLVKSFGQKPLYGADADDAAREVMRRAGVADHFTHRTGHSITTSIHGPGPNIDNLETEDRRLLQRGHLFSIEPGLYYHDCGFRSEVDLLITPNGAEVTTLPLQQQITPLLE